MVVGIMIDLLAILTVLVIPGSAYATVMPKVCMIGIVVINCLISFYIFLTVDSIYNKISNSADDVESKS